MWCFSYMGSFNIVIAPKSCEIFFRLIKDPEQYQGLLDYFNFGGLRSQYFR